MKHLLLARQRHYSHIMLYSKVTKCWYLCDVVNWKLESYCPQIYEKSCCWSPLTTDGEKATNITIQLPNNLSSSLPILLPPFNNERNTTTAYETMSIRTDESQITKRTTLRLGFSMQQWKYKFYRIWLPRSTGTKQQWDKMYCATFQ